MLRADQPHGDAECMALEMLQHELLRPADDHGAGGFGRRGLVAGPGGIVRGPRAANAWREFQPRK